MLTRREVILAKIESAYGVDAAPTGAANAILVENPSWAHAGARMIERPAIVGSLGTRQSIFGGTLMQVSFDVELKGSGAAGTPPELGVLLRACAFAETISAGASVTYEPVSAQESHESLTLYYYVDGMLHKVLGCRGRVTGNLEAGNIGKLNFSFIGHPEAAVDATLVTPTYDSAVPPVYVNAPFAIGGYAAVIASLAFDAGLTVATPPNPAAANGYGQIRITGRNITGSFDPEAVLVATHDFLGKWRSGALMALDTGVIGGTAGNRYRLQLPKVYYRELAPGDRDGLRTFQVGYGAIDDAGDDSVSIQFT